MPTKIQVAGQMDFAAIRRGVIVALFSDDTLLNSLVLKGGNALALVYGIGHRASLDVDLSIDGDFKDTEDAKRRILMALEKRFQRDGYQVVDFRFEPKPARQGEDATRSGYSVEFKLIESKAYDRLKGDPQTVSRNALVTSPNQGRTFKIEFSKHEFCKDKREVVMDDYTVYVYTPDMLAIEKLRALCQQLPEYEGRSYKTPRARDFYDIYALVTTAE